jgi:hypothetical protein
MDRQHRHGKGTTPVTGYKIFITKSHGQLSFRKTMRFQVDTNSVGEVEGADIELQQNSVAPETHSHEKLSTLACANSRIPPSSRELAGTGGSLAMQDRGSETFAQCFREVALSDNLPQTIQINSQR